VGADPCRGSVQLRFEQPAIAGGSSPARASIGSGSRRASNRAYLGRGGAAKNLPDGRSHLVLVSAANRGEGGYIQFPCWRVLLAGIAPISYTWGTTRGVVVARGVAGLHARATLTDRSTARFCRSPAWDLRLWLSLRRFQFLTRRWSSNSANPTFSYWRSASVSSRRKCRRASHNLSGRNRGCSRRCGRCRSAVGRFLRWAQWAPGGLTEPVGYAVPASAACADGHTNSLTDGRPNGYLSASEPTLPDRGDGVEAGHPLVRSRLDFPSSRACATPAGCPLRGSLGGPPPIGAATHLCSCDRASAHYVDRRRASSGRSRTRPVCVFSPRLADADLPEGWGEAGASSVSEPRIGWRPSPRQDLRIEEHRFRMSGGSLIMVRGLARFALRGEPCGSLRPSLSTTRSREPGEVGRPPRRAPNASFVK